MSTMLSGRLVNSTTTRATPPARGDRALGCRALLVDCDEARSTLAAVPSLPPTAIAASRRSTLLDDVGVTSRSDDARAGEASTGDDIDAVMLRRGGVREERSKLLAALDMFILTKRETFQ